MDFKYKDVEALPDKSIDLCLFNGAIRNSEQEYMAHLLREKSKVLVAYGTCAYTGGIPGLANVANREAIFQRVYQETPSTVNADGVRPQLRYQVPEGELTLPVFYDTVRTLAQVVPVEYFVPGCPPVKEQTEAVLQAVMEGRLPAPGSVVGASDKTVCDDCTRIKEEKRVRSFHRPYEIIPDPPAACWNRASSVPVRPRGAAVAHPVSPSTCPVGAATGRRRTWWTRAGSC